MKISVAGEDSKKPPHVHAKFPGRSIKKITSKTVSGYVSFTSLSDALSRKFEVDGVPVWIEDEAKFYHVPVKGGPLQEVPSNIKIVLAKAVLSVHISEITEKGFRLQVLDRDYYLTRERYPYFSDATEEEIKDASLLWESCVRWDSLDLSFELEQLDHPEEGDAFSQYVRGVHRPDLFVKFFDKKTGLAMIAIARELEEKNRQKEKCPC